MNVIVWLGLELTTIQQSSSLTITPKGLRITYANNWLSLNITNSILTEIYTDYHQYWALDFLSLLNITHALKFYTNIFTRLNDFNGILTRQGLLYAKRLGNCQLNMTNFQTGLFNTYMRSLEVLSQWVRVGLEVIPMKE